MLHNLVQKTKRGTKDEKTDRTKNLLDRGLDRHSLTTKIFAFLLCAVILFGMNPMSVLADTKENLPSGGSLVELASDDEMEENHGTITTNKGIVRYNGTVADRQGTVTTNNGQIDNNYGTVTVNEKIAVNNIIGTNYGTVTTNNGVVNTNMGTVQNHGSGLVKDNAGEVTGGVIQHMNDGNATGATISISMSGGTATNCKLEVADGMTGGTAINCTIGLDFGWLISTFAGGTAINCEILEMTDDGTAIDCTIEKMTGGTARGANTVINDYQRGDVSVLVPLSNITKDGKTVTEDEVTRVPAIPSEVPGTSGGGGLENPYYLFLIEAMPQLQDAAQGATVELKMDDWNTLTIWFMKEMAAREDLTIHMIYRYEGKTYDVTFPAGMTLMIDENIPYYGPLKLADMAIRGGGSCNITQ